MTARRRPRGRHGAALTAPCLVVLLVASACSSATRPPELRGEVKLAVAVPLTGDLADFGQTIADGVRLAAVERNGSGGLLGRKVVVEVFDDRANKDNGAVEAAEKITASGAKAVIGHFNSGASIPAAPLYAEAGVLQITPTSTNPKLTELGIQTVFRVSANDATQGPRIAALMRRDGRRRPAVLYAAGNTYAEGLSSRAADALSAEGAPPVVTQSFPAGTKDWATQIDAMKAAKPDSLLVVAEAPQAAAFLVQARQAGLDVPVFGGDSLAKAEFLFQAGSAADGAKVTALLPDVVTGKRKDADLVADYRDRFGRNPGIDTPAGLVAADVWFRGVEKAKSFDAGKVAAALKSGFRWESPIGEISYDSDGDLRRQVVYVNVVRNGRFVQE